MFKPPVYEDLTHEELTEKFDALINEWNTFLEQTSRGAERDKDYYIHKKNMFEIIRRCDKRRVYMEMFHDLKEICEYKTIALESFWIITLKPFMVVNEALSIYGCPNEMFSLFRIISVIRAAYEKRNPGKKFEYPSPARIQDILYDFKYCSISREAMVAFIETFADVYGVGISDIFKRNEEAAAQAQAHPSP